jgi:hypothetical protein
MLHPTCCTQRRPYLQANMNLLFHFCEFYLQNLARLELDFALLDTLGVGHHTWLSTKFGDDAKGSW